MLEIKDSDELRRRLDRVEWEIDSVGSFLLNFRTLASELRQHRCGGAGRV
jgi:hypothetical protein